MARRETRGRLLSGQRRERRDDILGALKNVMGDSFQYIQLSVPPVPSVSVSTSVIAETPVSVGPIALSVPAVPSVNVSTLVKYKTTYNGNGNSGGAVPTDANWYESGATVTVLGNTGALTKEGHTWSCWNTAADGSGTDYDAAETFELSGMTILYAKWTED
jgi:hypothetical protein